MRTSTTVKAIAALGTLSGALWAGTFASFSDSQTATATFTAGTVDLTLNGTGGSTYTFTSLNLAAMKPGDGTYAPLTVTNNGTLPYTYSMSSSATNVDTKGLGAALVLGMKLVASAAACDAGGAGYAASSTTVVPEGPLGSAAISTRPLAAGAAEVLCTYVSLPSNASNSLQGATTDDTMTFSATS